MDLGETGVVGDDCLANAKESVSGNPWSGLRNALGWSDALEGCGVRTPPEQLLEQRLEEGDIEVVQRFIDNKTTSDPTSMLRVLRHLNITRDKAVSGMEHPIGTTETMACFRSTTALLNSIAPSHCRFRASSQFIRTENQWRVSLLGMEQFLRNQALSGAIRPGQLIEIHGSAASGKTRLAQFLIHENSSQYRSFYIDTCNNLIEAASQKDSINRGGAPGRIRGCRLFDTETLIAILCKIIESEENKIAYSTYDQSSDEPMRPLFLVLDSMTLFLVSHTDADRSAIVQIGHLLRTIAGRLQALVIVLNAASNALWDACCAPPSPPGMRIEMTSDGCAVIGSTRSEIPRADVATNN